ADVISRMATEWLKRKARGSFKELPVAVQRRCLQLQLHSRRAELNRQKIPAEFELVEHLRTKPGRAVKLSREIVVIADAEGKVTCRESKVASGLNPAECALELNGRSGEIVFANVKFEWRILSGKGRRPKPRAGVEIFDADRIGPRIVLRHWRAGDRFH